MIRALCYYFRCGCYKGDCHDLICRAVTGSLSPAAGCNGARTISASIFPKASVSSITCRSPSPCLPHQTPCRQIQKCVTHTSGDRSSGGNAS